MGSSATNAGENAKKGPKWQGQQSLLEEAFDGHSPNHHTTPAK